MQELHVMRGKSLVTKVNVELARSPGEHERGLMFRKELPEGQGMYFIFGEDTDHPFWMKDTYVSLDIIFIDQAGKVVSIKEKATPLSENLIVPARAYRYVLEVPAGFVEKHRIHKGDAVMLR